MEGVGGNKEKFIQTTISTSSGRITLKNCLRKLRSDLLNPKFGSQKSALLVLKSHNFSET